MANEKSPKASKKSQKTESKKTKVSPRPAQAKKDTSSTSLATELDFGDKLTWIFNNWRAIWDAFILNIGSYLLAIIIPAFVAFTAVLAAAAAAVTKVSTSVASGVSTTGLIIAFIFVLIAIIVAAFFAPTIAIIQLNSVRDKKIAFGDAVNTTKQFVVRYLVMYLLIILAVVLPIIMSIILMKVAIGFLLFPLAIAFALFVGFFTALAPYLLIDNDLQVTEALNQSFEVTKQNWQWVLAVSLVVGLVSFAASIIFNILGIFGTLLSSLVSAVLSFAIAFVYVKQIAKK